MSTSRFAMLPVFGVALVLTGCHKSIPAPAVVAPAPVRAPAAVPVPPPAPPAPPRAAPPAPRPLTEDEIFARKSVDALNAEHPLRDAFFDYDQAALRDDAQSALQSDAQWLSRWKSVAVTVQGQCDERGSSEYNLALGSRRASSVKEYLSSLGVPDSRVTTISLGKESPVCTEANEACWSRNRRGHFVITAK